MIEEVKKNCKAAREKRSQSNLIVALTSLSLSAFLMSALALLWNKPLTVKTVPWAESILDFASIAIAAVSMLGTFGFLIFAFGIWDEKRRILDDRKEFEDLTIKAIGLLEETHQIKEDTNQVLKEVKARHGDYQDIYESLMLYNTIIRYIGNPLWEEASPDDDDGREAERERVDRHVSLTRLLMTMFAKDQNKDVELQQLIDLCRDAVGHLRKNDDQIFFDFLKSRLDRMEPKFETERETMKEIRRRFHLLRDNPDV